MMTSRAAALRAFLVLAFLVLAVVGTGCGDASTTVTGAPPGPPRTTRTYGTDPIDTGLLLRDTSETVHSMTTAATGVHFTMERYESAAVAGSYNLGEGDMAAGKASMKTRSSVGGELRTGEFVTIDAQTYTRSAPGVWQRSSRGAMVPEIESLTDYLDLARSSRNFGQETLADGRKTFHVQVDVDSVLAMEAAKKRTNDPATQVSLEAIKGASLTVDLWIGWDDQLVYQEKVVIAGAAPLPGSETTYQYSGWGEPVDIIRPCDAC